MPAFCDQDSFHPFGNLLLKHQEAVLTKVKNSISFESFMDLRNSHLFRSTELFPKEAAERAIEKSFWVPHDQAIGKAVSADKPAKMSTKRL